MPQSKKSAETVSRRLSDVAVVGRDAERRHLSTVIAAGRMPRVMLISGAEGVGKQRMAMWIAQALLCRTRGAPCGVCGDCVQVARLGHPDLHLYLPHESLGGGTAEALMEKAEVVRAEALEARRGAALYPPPSAGATYQVATVRALRRQVASKAYSSGGTRVFVIAAAELLSPREGSEDAANALLKTLEEPPPGAYFILTTSTVERVLPTIRSRTVEYRLMPLSTSGVAGVLRAAGIDDTRASEGSRYSNGSVTRALRWLDPEWQATRERAIEVLRAAVAADDVARCDLMAAQDFKNARAAFSALLSQVERLCFEAVVFLSGTEDEGFSVDPRIASLPGIQSTEAIAWARCASAAAQARQLAEKNAAPFLVLRRLLHTARRNLRER
jgi:DNA polymerase III delta prime subunit